MPGTPPASPGRMWGSGGSPSAASPVVDDNDFTGPLVDGSFPEPEELRRQKTERYKWKPVNLASKLFRRSKKSLPTVTWVAVAGGSSSLLGFGYWYVLQPHYVDPPGTLMRPAWLDRDYDNHTQLRHFVPWSFPRASAGVDDRDAINGLYKHPSGSYSFSNPLTLPADPRQWTENEYRQEFQRFVQWYDRRYDQVNAMRITVPTDGTEAMQEEVEVRFATFRKNLEFIHRHNLDAERGLKRYKLAPNPFTDMTWEEFRAFKLDPWPTNWQETRKADPRRRELFSLELVSKAAIPDEVDWIRRGCVNKIKDQGLCGSCWAFATTGAIESAICAATGELPNLSEQQLVDCATPEGAKGCNGGFMDMGFQYTIDAAGLCSEQDYPYEARDDICRAGTCNKIVQIDGLVDIPPGKLGLVAKAVALHGPVAVGIEADQPQFQFYHSGVFDAPCGTRIDHALLITGYGKLDGEAYFNAKNSWGEAWGDHGYVKLDALHHGRYGECGLATTPSFPVVSEATLEAFRKQAEAKKHPQS